jgi:hypothetical protein
MSSLRNLRKFKNITSRIQRVQDGPGTLYESVMPGETVTGAGYSYLEKFPQNFMETTSHISVDEFTRVVKLETDITLLKRMGRVEAFGPNREPVLRLLAARIEMLENPRIRQENETGVGAAAGKK